MSCAQGSAGGLVALRESGSHSAAMEGMEVSRRKRSRFDNGDEAEECRGSGRGVDGDGGGGGGGGGAELGIADGPLNHFAPSRGTGCLSCLLALLSLVMREAGRTSASDSAIGRWESGARGSRQSIGVGYEGAGLGRRGQPGRRDGAGTREGRWGCRCDAVGMWLGCGRVVVAGPGTGVCRNTEPVTPVPQRPSACVLGACGGRAGPLSLSLSVQLCWGKQDKELMDGCSLQLLCGSFASSDPANTATQHNKNHTAATGNQARTPSDPGNRECSECRVRLATVTELVHYSISQFPDPQQAPVGQVGRAWARMRLQDKPAGGRISGGSRDGTGRQ